MATDVSSVDAGYVRYERGKFCTVNYCTVGAFLPFSIPERFHSFVRTVLVATVLEETAFRLHWTACAAHYNLVASEFTAFLKGPQSILYCM